MAFVEVPEVPRGQFLKVGQIFGRIGDKLDAVYVGQAEGRYGTDFTFNTDLGAATLTLKGALKAQLDKASRDGLLRPGARTLIQFAKEVPTGKESPMRSFKLAVDADFKGALPKSGPNVANAFAAARANAAGGGGSTPDEDVPF